jgi:hypothetical protein
VGRNGGDRDVKPTLSDVALGLQTGAIIINIIELLQNLPY